MLSISLKPPEIVERRDVVAPKQHWNVSNIFAHGFLNLRVLGWWLFKWIIDAYMTLTLGDQRHEEN